MKHKMNLSLFLVLITCLLSACSNDFEQYYQATRVRLLGIDVDKPMLKPSEVATLTAVSYIPKNASSTTTYEWSWCPFRTYAKDKYKCPITRDILVNAVKKEVSSSVNVDALIPTLDLPSGQQTTFKYPGPEAAVLGLCRMTLKFAEIAKTKYGINLPSFDCQRNYEIDIRLVMKNGDTTIIGVKRIALWIGDPDVNEDPKILRLQIRPKKGENYQQLKAAGASWIPNTTDVDKMWYTLPDSQPTPVVENGLFELRSVVDPVSIQTWHPPKRFGEQVAPPPEKEPIKFSWFINTPDTLKFLQSGIYREGKTNLDDVSNIIWIPKCRPDSAKPVNKNCDPVQVWSFIRDGRLGVNWMTRSFDIAGTVPPRPKEEDDK